MVQVPTATATTAASLDQVPAGCAGHDAARERPASKQPANHLKRLSKSYNIVRPIDRKIHSDSYAHDRHTQVCKFHHVHTCILVHIYTTCTPTCIHTRVHACASARTYDIKQTYLYLYNLIHLHTQPDMCTCCMNSDILVRASCRLMQ